MEYISSLSTGNLYRSQFAPVWGDLNWLPFSIRAGYQAAQYWMRVSKLDDACLVRKAMCVQRDLVNNGRPCWLANLKTMLLSTKDTHIKKLWNEWIANDELSRFNTRIVRLKRLRFDRVYQCRQVPREAHGKKWLA